MLLFKQFVSGVCLYTLGMGSEDQFWRFMGDQLQADNSLISLFRWIEDNRLLGKVLALEEVNELNPGFFPTQVLDCFQSRFLPSNTEFDTQELIPSLELRHLQEVGWNKRCLWEDLNERIKRIKDKMIYNDLVIKSAVNDMSLLSHDAQGLHVQATRLLEKPL